LITLTDNTYCLKYNDSVEEEKSKEAIIRIFVDMAILIAEVDSKSPAEGGRLLLIGLLQHPFSTTEATTNRIVGTGY
jgi:hypothetical protein